LAARLVVSPLAAILRSRTNLDFYLLEGMFIALVILFVPALRRRVAESLRYLFSTNVNHVRQATRNLSLKLSQNATLDREDLIEWFAGELRESIGLVHVSILVGDTGASVAPQIKRMPALLLSGSQAVQNKALLSLGQLVIGFGQIVERGELKQRVESAAAMASSDKITPLDLGLSGIVDTSDAAPFQAYLDLPLTEGRDRVVEDFERSSIKNALTAEAGNISAAARRLGVHRQSLQRKIAKLGIATPS